MGEETTRLREEIGQTRADLTRDVDLITDRTSPSRIARRRWDRVRAAGTSVKERVMGGATDSGRYTADVVRGGAQGAMETVQGTASSAVETVQGTTQNAVQTTRRTTEGNPLAAGLLAFGVGWLASSLLPASEAERRATESAKQTVREHSDVVQPMVEQAKQGAQEVGQHLKEQAAQSAQEVREHAQQAASTVAEEGRSAGRNVTDEARSAGQDVSEQAKTSAPRVSSGSGGRRG
jgi:ElaB/YqjD/DUF883 family membrane-anchored ribosome-binding protein